MLKRHGGGTDGTLGTLVKQYGSPAQARELEALELQAGQGRRYLEALRGKDIFDPRKVSYAVIETNGTLSAALRPEQEAATLSDLQLKVQQTQATIPFVLDGQILEDNLRWCGKDRAWLERTAMANTVLPQEILLLIGNETEDYFLLKKEGHQPGGK